MADLVDPVTITHPSNAGGETARVERSAFEAVWQAKGWTVVPDPAPDAPDATPASTATPAPTDGAPAPTPRKP